MAVMTAYHGEYASFAVRLLQRRWALHRVDAGWSKELCRSSSNANAVVRKMVEKSSL